MLKNLPKKRIKDLPLNKIAPNIVTMFALSSGVTAIRFAMEGRFELAVFAVLLAAIFDALDGRVARLLKGTSDFGAELDSLSDVVCFGVAPGLLMYFWTKDMAVPVNWIVALLVPICAALRLARFNIMLDDEPQPKYWRHFFVGLPAPGGALVALTPAMLYFYFRQDFFRSGYTVNAFLLLSAGLMASRLPTVSLKYLRIPMRYVLPVLLLGGFVAGAFLYSPWLTVGTLGLLYLLSVPLSCFIFMRLKRHAEPSSSKPESAENTENAEKS